MSLWATLTIVSFGALMVFAILASIFVARLVRRPTLPLSEDVGGVAEVLRKLRKREPMTDEEVTLARQAVTDRGSFLALCIPLTIFSIGCFYVFGSSNICTAYGLPNARSSASSRCSPPPIWASGCSRAPA